MICAMYLLNLNQEIVMYKIALFVVALSYSFMVSAGSSGTWMVTVENYGFNPFYTEKPLLTSKLDTYVYHDSNPAGCKFGGGVVAWPDESTQEMVFSMLAEAYKTGAELKISVEDNKCYEGFPIGTLILVDQKR